MKNPVDRPGRNDAKRKTVPRLVSVALTAFRKLTPVHRAANSVWCNSTWSHRAGLPRPTYSVQACRTELQ